MGEIVKQVEELYNHYRAATVELAELRSEKADVERTLQETAAALDQANASLGWWQKQLQHFQLMTSELTKAKYDREEMYKEMCRAKNETRAYKDAWENALSDFVQKRGAVACEIKHNRDNLLALADDVLRWTLPLNPEAQKEQPPDETPQPSLVGAD